MRGAVAVFPLDGRSPSPWRGIAGTADQYRDLCCYDCDLCDQFPWRDSAPLLAMVRPTCDVGGHCGDDDLLPARLTRSRNRFLDTQSVPVTVSMHHTDPVIGVTTRWGGSDSRIMQQAAQAITRLRKLLAFCLPASWLSRSGGRHEGLRPKRPTGAAMEIEPGDPASSWVAWEKSTRPAPRRSAAKSDTNRDQ